MKLNTQERKKMRVRKKLKKNAKLDRYRLSVSRSSKNISAQIIDDIKEITLVSASSINLLRIIVEVTFVPSNPANGEVFTVIVIDIVGGSIGVDFKGVKIEVSQIVSATDACFKPAIQIISPASTRSTGTLSVLLKRNSFVSLFFSIIIPSKFTAWTFALTSTKPCSTLPTRHLPRKGSDSRSVTSIAKGLSNSTTGGDTYSSTRLSRG